MLLLQSGVVIQVCSHIFTVPFVWRAVYCHSATDDGLQTNNRPLSPYYQPLLRVVGDEIETLLSHGASMHAYQDTNRIERDSFFRVFLSERETVNSRVFLREFEGLVRPKFFTI